LVGPDAGRLRQDKAVSATGDCSTHGLCHNPNLGARREHRPAWSRAGENIGTGFDVQGLQQRS
jgi:hypothetical protein